MALVIGAILIYGLAATPPGPRTLRQFDPDRMADLELRMWKAYYAKERVSLFAAIGQLLRESYRDLHLALANDVTDARERRH